MSQENIESVRRALEAIGRADFDAALSLVHRNIEFFPPGDQPPYRGAESFRRWMEPDAFVEQVIKPLEFVELEGGKVLGRQHIKARGAGSGIEMETTTWSVWTFDDDGLITRVEVFLPHEEARARQAAGRRE
jgi:ketosteroid isomerase-like protein